MYLQISIPINLSKTTINICSLKCEDDREQIVAEHHTSLWKTVFLSASTAPSRSVSVFLHLSTILCFSLSLSLSHLRVYQLRHLTGSNTGKCSWCRSGRRRSSRTWTHNYTPQSPLLLLFCNPFHSKDTHSYPTWKNRGIVINCRTKMYLGCSPAVKSFRSVWQIFPRGKAWRGCISWYSMYVLQSRWFSDYLEL